MPPCQPTWAGLSPTDIRCVRCRQFAWDFQERTDPRAYGSEHQGEYGTASSGSLEVRATPRSWCLQNGKLHRRWLDRFGQKKAQECKTTEWLGRLLGKRLVLVVCYVILLCPVPDAPPFKGASERCDDALRRARQLSLVRKANAGLVNSLG